MKGSGVDFQLPPHLKLLYAAPPPSERDIRLTEEIIGRVLPDEFKNLARLANGGQPEPNKLDLGLRRLNVDFFLAFGPAPPVSKPGPQAGPLKKSALKLLDILNGPPEPPAANPLFGPAGPSGFNPGPTSPALAEEAASAKATAAQEGMGGNRTEAPAGISPPQLLISPQEAITIVEVWRDLNGRLPPGLTPIAAESGGGYFCYDYNFAPPPVVFWEPRAVWPLPAAGSLQEFLKLLAAKPH